MKKYAIVQDADGLVRSRIAVQDLETLLVNVPEGCHPVPCEVEEVTGNVWRWTEAAGFEPAPGSMDIAHARFLAWEGAKDQRGRAERWGCTTPLGRADTDADSQRKVAGAVQMAMIAQAAGAPFSIEWTMQDNSVVTHDAAAMIVLGVAVGQHVAACHAVALSKRAAIEAAIDVDAVTAVDIAGGWPDAPTG